MSDRSLSSKSSVSKRVQQSPPASGYYRVQPGDTLYSIAWRYGKDFRALARSNKIGSDFRIYPGQKLRLVATPLPSPPRQSPTKKPPTKAIAKSDPKVKTSVAAKVVKPVKAAVPAVATPKTQVVVKPDTRKKLPLRWQWPSKGKLLRHFQPRGKVNKGVDIAGSHGEPVYSAASGKVVYSGNGLLGYGNLIIINHNEQFLSAYAHNSRLLVRENQSVKVGQKIAEMGNSGAARIMLHFEIRKDGKPVNPLRYLPKR